MAVDDMCDENGKKILDDLLSRIDAAPDDKTFDLAIYYKFNIPEGSTRREMLAIGSAVIARELKYYKENEVTVYGTLDSLGMIHAALSKKNVYDLLKNDEVELIFEDIEMGIVT